MEFAKKNDFCKEKEEYMCDDHLKHAYTCAADIFNKLVHCGCFCSKIISVCEESQMCPTHCVLENHSHCVFPILLRNKHF